MAKFRMVYQEFWSDPKVVEEMTPEDKYFFLYLLTNPNTTQSGIYQITKKQIAFDTGYSIESVNALIDRFQNHHKLIKYNLETRELALRNWGKHNLNRGGKPMIDCIVSELKNVRDVSLIKYVGQHVNNSSIKALYDTYHDTSTMRGQEEEEEEEKEQEEEQEEYGIGFSKSLSFFSSQFALMPSPFLIDKLNSLIDEYTDEWVMKALEISLLANKRDLRYVSGILTKWKERNFPEPWKEEKDAKHGGVTQGVRSGTLQGTGTEGESEYAFLGRPGRS